MIIKLVSFLVCCNLLYFALGEVPIVRSDAEEAAIHAALFFNDGAFEGDMILTPEQKAAKRSRVATEEPNARWPNGLVYYKFDPSLKGLEANVLKAMAHVTSSTGGKCITFAPAPPAQKNYINIKDGGGCSSQVGMVGGVQDVNLNKTGCLPYTSTIAHELLHAIGFDHEHNRNDRDGYITIYLNNVIKTPKDMSTNFVKRTKGILYKDVPFDYNSVMIYGETAFSVDVNNKSKRTMVDKNGKIELTNPDRKPGLSPSDVKQVKYFYGCK